MHFRHKVRGRMSGACGKESERLTILRVFISHTTLGNLNTAPKHLFSTFDYKHAATGYKGSFSERNNFEGCDPLTGCPLGVHAGVTSLRQRSLPTGAVGTAVPTGNRKMDMGKEFEWAPNPYDSKVKMVSTLKGDQSGRSIAVVTVSIGCVSCSWG